jgi:hypothetical protein
LGALRNCPNLKLHANARPMQPNQSCVCLRVYHALFLLVFAKKSHLMVFSGSWNLVNN